MTRRPRLASSSTTPTSETSKNWPSSIATTSVSAATSGGISAACSTTWEGIFISEWLTISASE